MPTVKVVPCFDEVEDRELGFLVRAEAVVVEQLAFQGSVEALAHRIIVAVSNRAHRRANVRFPAARAERDRRILRPLV